MSENNNEAKEIKQGFFSKLKLWQKVVYILVIIVVVSMVFILLGGGNSAVNIVKNGEFNNYKSATIGKAFDKFFANPEWKSSETTDKRTIINFQGMATLDNKPVKLSINFEVDKESKRFEIINLYVDGNIQPDSETIDWLDTIFK